jgi:hypothetical protein
VKSGVRVDISQMIFDILVSTLDAQWYCMSFQGWRFDVPQASLDVLKLYPDKSCHCTLDILLQARITICCSRLTCNNANTYSNIWMLVPVKDECVRAMLHSVACRLAVVFSGLQH